MPPRDKGEAVPKEKAAVVAQWIKEGAKLDAGLDPKADLVTAGRLKSTDGVYGIRFAHNTEGTVSGLALTK